MLILTLRTDKPESEIGLFDDDKQLYYESWTAHKQLAETIHHKIVEVLQGQSRSLQDIGGIVVYKGPGSFTGLRIGLTVANALTYGLYIPIVSISGENWLLEGIGKLLHGDNETVALPEYGAPVFTTQQKK